MKNKEEKNASPEQQESLLELLKHLVKHSIAMMRHEVELVIRRLHERFEDVRSGFMLMAVGAAIGFAAFLCMCAALIIELSRYLSPAVAALLTGGVLALAGVVLGFVGYRKLSK